MAVKKSASILSLLVILSMVVSTAQGRECNPIVDPLESDTSLVGTLSRLAEKYEFVLSLPASLDRQIHFNKSLPLDRLIKYLTADMNTVLKHKKVNGCASPVLVQLIVLPNSQETLSEPIQPSAAESVLDYIYIDDMESYVSRVIEGQQQAELDRMTPEQRVEFEMLRETMSGNPEVEPASN